MTNGPTEPTPSWKIGDVANHHLLVASGWVPLVLKHESAGPVWTPGDVVNGHAFTGSDWVRVPAAQMQAFNAPAFATSAQRQGSSRTGKILGIGCVVPVGLVVVLAIIGGALGGSGALSSPKADAADQADFVAAVEVSQQAQTDNDPQIVQEKRARAARICSILPGSLAVEGWTGTVTDIDTELGGDSGTVKIEIGKEIEVVTEQGMLDMNDTMIDTDSRLYSQLAALSVGQEVSFGGEFVEDSDYCISEESSLSENGLRTPDFLMRFSSITPS